MFLHLTLSLQPHKALYFLGLNFPLFPIYLVPHTHLLTLPLPVLWLPIFPILLVQILLLLRDNILIFHLILLQLISQHFEDPLGTIICLVISMTTYVTLSSSLISQLVVLLPLLLLLLCLFQLSHSNQSLFNSVSYISEPSSYTQASLHPG